MPIQGLSHHLQLAAQQGPHGIIHGAWCNEVTHLHTPLLPQPVSPVLCLEGYTYNSQTNRLSGQTDRQTHAPSACHPNPATPAGLGWQAAAPAYEPCPLPKGTHTIVKPSGQKLLHHHPPCLPNRQTINLSMHQPIIQ